MNSFKTFRTLLGISHREILMMWNRYKLSFMALLALNLTIAVPWSNFDLGFMYLENLINFFALIFSLMIGVNIILIDKSLFIKRNKETVFYQFPTYLIYTIYAGGIALGAGAIVFAMCTGIFHKMPVGVYLGYGVGGLTTIVLAVLFSMSPLNAILIDSDHVNYLKESFKMGKKHFGVLFLFTLCTFITELPEFLIYLIDTLWMRLAVGSFYALIDTWFAVLILKLGVKLFYLFYEKREDLKLV